MHNDTHLIAHAEDGEILIALHDSDPENYGDQLADVETITADTASIDSIEDALTAAGYRVTADAWECIDSHYSAHVVAR